MLLRRLAVLISLGVAVGVGLPGTAAAAPAVANVGTTRICTGCAAGSGDLSRYGYVTLHAWEHGRIAAIKRANPAVKVLVYKDMAATQAYACHGGRDEPLLSSGMGYCWTLANHPDWFSEDESGRRVEWHTWRGNWQMDVGSPDYQAQWAANVQSELQRYGWDGVVVDDVNVDYRPHVGSRALREYPTQRSYQAATRSFLAHVGPRLTGAGFLVIPNIQADPVLADDDLWADWIQFTSGGTREYWMKWGSGADGHYGAGGWSDLMSVFETVQRAGKIFLTTTTAPASDVRTQRWGRASFLVGWNGGPSAFIFDPNAAADPWTSEWTADIGRPLGPRARIGADVWRRAYSGGAALVNISERSAQTVELGSSYLTPEGLPVTEITLAPMSGVVLRFAPGAAPPASAAPNRVVTARRQAKSRRPASRVSLAAQPAVRGKVHASQAAWRVSVYLKAGRGWRLFARVRTQADGRFRVAKPIRARRALQVRAVARVGRSWVSSPVVEYTA